MLRAAISRRLEAGQPAGGLDRQRMIPAGQAAGGVHLGRQVGRQEIAGVGVVAQPGLGQGQGTRERREAGGGHQQVAFDLALDAALDGAQRDLVDLFGAVRSGRHPAAQEGDLALGQGQQQVGVLAVFANVGDAGDLHSQIAQVDGRFQAQIVPDAEDRPVARQQSVGARQPVGAADLHDPRALVVFKQERPFDAAGRHDHAGRPDLDVAFVESPALRADLKGRDQVVVVEPHVGRVREDPDVGRGLHL